MRATGLIGCRMGKVVSIFCMICHEDSVAQWLAVATVALTMVGVVDAVVGTKGKDVALFALGFSNLDMSSFLIFSVFLLFFSYLTSLMGWASFWIGCGWGKKGSSCLSSPSQMPQLFYSKGCRRLSPWCVLS